MAKCNLSAKELTVDTFSPRVAVLCSPSAHAICDKNNLKFTQLIQPFTSLTTTLSWREPNGGQIFPKQLKLTPVDLASWKPANSDTQKNRNIQYSVVAQCLPPTQQLIESLQQPKTTQSSTSAANNTADSEEESTLQQLLLKTQKVGKRVNGISCTDYTVVFPPSTPWYETWRETFLTHFVEQTSSATNQHEFLSQFIACILVISSCEGSTSDEIGSIVGKLSKLQLQHQTEWPQTWFLPSVLKYYVILHDNNSGSGAGNLAEAESNYQVLRSMYGGNFCHMLKINSGNKEEPSVKDPWTYFINHQQHFSEPSPDVVEATEGGGSASAATEFFNFNEIPHPLSPETPSKPLPFLANGGNKEFLVNQNHHDQSQLPHHHQQRPPPHMNDVLTPNPRKSIIRGQFMTSDDLQNIQITINEFWGKSLFPYIERQCRLLHESIVNRRSMSKSFFGATKRLFGSKTAGGAIVYPPDSSELMMRKLADLYFLFGHYAGAYQLYHQLKKDFQGDQAWPYYSSALEMAAVSHFMMTQTDSTLSQGVRSFPSHYIQEAIRCYLENCRMTDAAIRCAIICCECLKHLDNFAEAATVLIRMTSGECDLRSALMLEQAAYAFLQLNSPRKYALHSVLAGHRFNKAGLKLHSLNSYIQSGKIFFGRGWRLAEDHIHLTIGKHQSYLNLHTNLIGHFSSLLKFPTQSSTVEIYFKEFLTIAAKLHEENRSRQEFFIPKINCADIKVRIGSSGLLVGELAGGVEVARKGTGVSPSWDTLEEQVVKECVDSSVISFKPSRLLFDFSTNNAVHPIVPCDECFYVEIPFFNPLQIPLTIQNISLHFEAEHTMVDSSLVNELSLQPDETKFIRFDISGHQVGKLWFDWLHFELRLGAMCVPFKQKITLKGPRLNIFKADRGSKLYMKDLRNRIHVVEEMPLLQAEIEGLPSSLLQSQTTRFNIVLHDRSRSPEQRQRITKVVLASENMNQYLTVDQQLITNNNQDIRKNYCQLNLAMDGSTSRIPCIFSTPQSQQAHLHLLILYQVRPPPPKPGRATTPDGEEADLLPPKIKTPSYRVIKISINVPLLPSLRVDYFFLKSLTCTEFLGLLRVENVTQVGRIELDKLEFSPNDKYTIAQVTSGLSGPSLAKDDLAIASSESRNVVLRVQEVTAANSGTAEESMTAATTSPELVICLAWKFSTDTAATMSTKTTASRAHNNNLPPTPAAAASGLFKLPITIKALKNQILTTTSSASTAAAQTTIVSESESAYGDNFHFVVKHTTETSHDFNRSPCFVLPMVLEMYSCWSGKVTLGISTAKLASGDNGTETDLDSRLSNPADVVLIGQTKWTFQVEEYQKFKFNVGIRRPGVYNVAPYICLNLYSADGQQLLEPEQIFVLHSPLIIGHQNSSNWKPVHRLC